MANSSVTKLLFLTGDYGEGHKQAANALKEASDLYNHDIESVILDVTTLQSSNLDILTKHVFNTGVKKFPSLYHYFYQKTKEPNRMSQLLKDFTERGIDKLYEKIQDIQPRVLISTFPAAAGMVSRLKQKELINIPSITVITDHSVHCSWIHPETDLYIVGSEPVKEELMRQGIPNHKVAITGIPIHPKFAEPYHHLWLKDKHHVKKDLPTILIMGGGLGLFKGVFPLLKELETLPDVIQIIVVCGHNEQLKDKLMKFGYHSKHNIVVFGYVNFIDELMAISDIMISKPGGLTISEAIAMELPMIIYKTIGGQEQDNADFLISTQLALFAKDNKEVVNQIRKALTHTSILQEMYLQAKKLNYQKYSSKQTIELINELIEKEPYAIRLA